MKIEDRDESSLSADFDVKSAKLVAPALLLLAAIAALGIVYISTTITGAVTLLPMLGIAALFLIIALSVSAYQHIKMYQAHLSYMKKLGAKQLEMHTETLRKIERLNEAANSSDERSNS